MQEHEIRVHYSRVLVDVAAWRFFRRFVRTEVVVDVVFVVGVLALWAVGVLPMSVAGALVALGLGFMLLVAAVGWRYVRLARTKFEGMADPMVVWRFSDSTLATESDLGSMRVPWKAITKVWRFDEVWLLFFGGHGYSTLPTEALSPELRLFVEQRIMANGGKVT